MRLNIFTTLLVLVFLISINNVIANGGDHDHDTDDNEGFSLTLEQIYVITFVAAIILAFALEYIGVLKQRALVYKFLIFGLILLTIDYVIYKEYFA